MDKWIEGLKYIGPLIGVCVGWLLTRKSDKDKLLREDKKSLKMTLRLLLDLRHEINLTRRDEDFINIYIETAKTKFGEIEGLDPEQIKILVDLLGKMIDEAGLTMAKKASKYTRENFERVIDNLSEIDPILAYQLNGKQNIQEFFEEWEAISKKSLEEWVTEKDEIKNMIQHFKPKLLEEAVRELDVVLIEIAAQINKTTLLKTKEIITKRDIHEKQIEIYQFVERIFN
jgi:hypothetical protein